MGIMITLSALCGAVLGLSFNVFILFPAFIVAALGAGLIEIARGDQAWICHRYYPSCGHHNSDWLFDR
jgi:hypothetical protein